MQAKSKTQTTSVRSKSNEKAAADKKKNKENVSKKGKTEEKGSKRSVSKSKEPKDENAPKKALSSYMLWSLNERKKLKEEGVEGKDIMGELGQRWNKMADKDKKKWEDLHEKDKERYEREMKEAGLPLAAEKKAKTETKDQGDKKAGVGKKSEKEANKGKKGTEEKDKKKKEANKKKASKDDDDSQDDD